MPSSAIPSAAPFTAESDAFTARKFAAARKFGLIPILCVGELLDEREQGITNKSSVVSSMR